MKDTQGKLLLIGGIDSIGVPYTRDNKNKISHFTIIKDYLLKVYKNSKFIDLYCMSKYNTTQYISKLLNQNLTLEELKRNQIESIDICRKQGIFQFIQLSKNMKSYYTINENDKNIRISDEIRKNNTLFIYSCGTNDFLESNGTNLGKLLLSRNMTKAFENMEEKIKNIVINIERNIKEIINLNADVEIYIIGLYIPTTVKYIRSITQKPIEYFNQCLSNMCELYENVFFIDNSNLNIEHMAPIDWHPNTKGQEKIGENILNKIKKESKYKI